MRRPRLSIRLRGGTGGDGEIPLADLGRIATETQALVLRLARSLTERSGPGRTPDEIDELTRLVAVGIRSGSSILEIAGPEMEEELPLDGAPPNVGVQALVALADGLEAASAGRPLPVAFGAAPARRSLAEWMATVSTYSEVDVTVAVDDDERRVRLAPAEVVLPDPSTMAAPRPAALVGTLRAVDLDSGRFRIEDDAGHRIALTVPTELRDQAGRLIGNRVEAFADPSSNDARATQPMAVAELRAAPQESLRSVGDAASAAFLDRLSAGLAGTPLDALQPIADLTDDEANAFLDALEA